MSSLNDLIVSLGSGDEDAAQTHFQSAMADKIQSALDARKIEIANDIYNGGTIEVDEDESLVVDEYEVEEADEIQGSEIEAE